MTTSPNSLSKHDLRQFTGTEHWYRHSMVRWVLFTDGVKYVADKGGAYWLVDEMALPKWATMPLLLKPFSYGS